MSEEALKREMTAKEQQYLINILQHSPSGLKRWMEGAQNALVLWAASLLGLVIIWLLIAWLTNLIVQFDFGINSQYAIWIVSIITPICLLYAIFSSIKWVRKWPDHRVSLRQDIDDHKVLEEKYKVAEVKRFQEPEHGGLIYFLRMNNERILVLYDYESVDLEMNDQNALNSSFMPCRELKIVRAPNTQYFIEQEYSGEKMTLPDPIELTAQPEEWPEQDSWCDIPWHKLESRLSA